MSESKLSAFEEYYSQRDSKNRTIKVLVINKVRESYENMINSIFVLLVTSRKNKKYGSIASYKSLIRNAENIINNFMDGYQRNLSKKCTLIANYSIRSEIKDVSKFGIKSKAQSKDYDDSIKLYLDEQMGFAKAQASRMINQIWSIIRSDDIMIQRLMNLKNMSRRKAIEYHVANSELDLKFTFIDKSLRKKSSIWYFEMLANSMMKNIELDAYIYAMISDNLDIARINKCDGDHKCSRYDGEIISITNSSSKYRSFEDVQKEGYIWHPNCSHLITAIEENNESD